MQAERHSALRAPCCASRPRSRYEHRHCHAPRRGPPSPRPQLCASGCRDDGQVSVSRPDHRPADLPHWPVGLDVFAKGHCAGSLGLSSGPLAAKPHHSLLRIVDSGLSSISSFSVQYGLASQGFRPCGLKATDHVAGGEADALGCASLSAQLPHRARSRAEVPAAPRHATKRDSLLLPPGGCPKTARR